MREALGADFVAHFCCLKREGEIKELPMSNMKVETDVAAFKDELNMYGRFL
jgi:hypothetical protein